MKRVLILDANQRSALATARSLGKHCVPLITADETPTALTGCSRYSEHYFCYPNPTTEPEQFITTISKQAIENDIQIILPMTELTTTLLLQHRDNLPNNITVPFADLDTIDSLANKCSLMKLAETLNVPVPRTWFVDDPNNLAVDLETLTYPIVLKPGKSWVLVGKTWLHTSVRFANNYQQAINIIESDPAFQSHPFMLQECVLGHGQGVFALYNNGNSIAFFSHRRLREKPPRGGVSVLSESVPVNPILLSHAKSLLGAVNWHGVAMVEFKVAVDGTPYLMEINTRFWGSLQLSIDAGVDFPWLLYNMACSQPVVPIKNYKTRTRLRWLLGDLDNLYLTLRDKEITINKKMYAIIRFITPNPFKTKHEVNRWNDFGPFVWEIKQYLKNILR